MPLDFSLSSQHMMHHNMSLINMFFILKSVKLLNLPISDLRVLEQAHSQEIVQHSIINNKISNRIKVPLRYDTTCMLHFVKYVLFSEPTETIIVGFLRVSFLIHYNIIFNLSTNTWNVKTLS